MKKDVEHEPKDGTRVRFIPPHLQKCTALSPSISAPARQTYCCQKRIGVSPSSQGPEPPSTPPRSRRSPLPSPRIRPRLSQGRSPDPSKPRRALASLSPRSRVPSLSPRLALPSPRLALASPRSRLPSLSPPLALASLSPRSRAGRRPTPRSAPFFNPRRRPGRQLVHHGYFARPRRRPDRGDAFAWRPCRVSSTPGACSRFQPTSSKTCSLKG